MKQILGDLPARWRERAETLRTFGDPDCARLWEIAAIELERAQAVFAAEILSLTQAAHLSGYTADHPGRLVKSGKIVNAGRTNAPLEIRLGLSASGDDLSNYRPIVDSDHVGDVVKPSGRDLEDLAGGDFEIVPASRQQNV